MIPHLEPRVVSECVCVCVCGMFALSQKGDGSGARSAGILIPVDSEGKVPTSITNAEG